MIDIRETLKAKNITQVELCKMLLLRGVKTDVSQLNSVLSGTRHGPKADLIIRVTEDILKEI